MNTSAVGVGAESVRAALASAVAAERLRMVATIIRRTGDWELAEDGVQEAMTRALKTWPQNGIPDNPSAWLTAAAKNAALDLLRRARTDRATAEKAARELNVDLEEARARALGPATGVDSSELIDDDRLRLIFTCCHPALPVSTRVMLTLRTVAGLEVADIARAFLVTEPTMQKRLVRARARIRQAGIAYRVPAAAELDERTDAVLSVLYLLFTEGYAGGADLVRVSLADEAIRLTRLVGTLMTSSPQRAEILGLLALMLFQHSRAAARVDQGGDLVLLEDQDRELWDAAMIDEAVVVLDASREARTRRTTGTGPYQLQAEIARHHATARSFPSTDFARIAKLYALLVQITPGPVVQVQRAIAVGFAEGIPAGLALLDSVEGASAESYHLFHAARADLLRRAGRGADARVHYARALELAPSNQERRFLARRMEEL